MATATVLAGWVHIFAFLLCCIYANLKNQSEEGNSKPWCQQSSIPLLRFGNRSGLLCKMWIVFIFIQSVIIIIIIIITKICGSG